VPTSVNPDELCLNGMSFSQRQSQWANSALVVSVTPEDIDAYGCPGNYHSLANHLSDVYG
jgi:uncharacterized FAD-dependent dehydrogenase